MINAATLIKYCGSHGVQLHPKGELIDVDGPQDVVTDEFLEMLRSNKAAILAQLRYDAAADHESSPRSANSGRPNPHSDGTAYAAPRRFASLADWQADLGRGAARLKIGCPYSRVLVRGPNLRPTFVRSTAIPTAATEYHDGIRSWHPVPEHWRA
jgi:hypothetical protein